MSARRIARELAVIVFPQLPKDESKLESLELDRIVTRAVQMLVDHAKQCLADANALMLRSGEKLVEIEVEHQDNAQSVEELLPVPLTTAQLREQLDLIERSINIISEALDIPDMALQSGSTSTHVTCKKCKQVNPVVLENVQPTEVLSFLKKLVLTYVEHRQQIDEFIRQVKAKWKVERMVSIDRDILRLACTEAFFLEDIPIPVAINEAVELSHRFADDKAARFINGVLRDLAEEAKNFRRTGEFSQKVSEDDQLTSSTKNH